MLSMVTTATLRDRSRGGILHVVTTRFVSDSSSLHKHSLAVQNRTLSKPDHADDYQVRRRDDYKLVVF